MSPEADAYTLPDLCDLAGVTPRTVRYYIAQGLLVSPAGAGPGARYGAHHLARLRLIRRLQRDHLPLAEIRRRLAAISDEEAIERARDATAPPGDSALDYIRVALSTRGVPPAPEPPARALGVPTPSPAPASPPPGAARLRASMPGVGPSPGAAESLARSASLAGAGRAAETAAPYGPTEAEPIRSQWDRISLDPDIELHVRRPLSRAQSRAVDRLLEAARHLLREEIP
jgi:DNA-binding transcriptional MerR regulator